MPAKLREPVDAPLATGPRLSGNVSLLAPREASTGVGDEMGATFGVKQWRTSPNSEGMFFLLARDG